MSDLIERLRNDNESPCSPKRLLRHEAADEIERLTAQLESGMDGQSMLPTELLNGMHERIAKLEAIIATHADPTGDDDETIALILECFKNWQALQAKTLVTEIFPGTRGALDKLVLK